MIKAHIWKTQNKILKIYFNIHMENQVEKSTIKT